MFYHAMSVKFHVRREETVLETINKIKELHANKLDEYELCVDGDEPAAWIDINRCEVHDSKAGAAEALNFAVEIAVAYGDPDESIRLFDRAEEDGDDEGRNVLLSRNEDVLLKAGYKSFVADLEAITKKLRDLPKHIEQAADFSHDHTVMMLELNGNNFENHSL